MPSTTRRPLRGITIRTTPVLPRSLPVITRTLSLRRIFAISDHLRRQRHDFHEVALSQLTRYRTKDACTSGVLLIGQDHGRVFVEANVRAVGPAVWFGYADDDSFNDVALFYAC